MFKRRIADANWRAKLLDYSPEQLIKSGLFWSRQWSLLTISALAVAVTLFLMPLTEPQASDPISFLAVVIYPLAFWGVYLTAKMLAQIEIEHAIVVEVEERGSSKLADIRSDAGRRIELSVLEDTVIPKFTSESTPAMVQMFQHICQDAKDRSFESRVTVMQPHREKSLTGILELQNIQKTALRLGILGTFIGLLMAIIVIENRLENSAVPATKNIDLIVEQKANQEEFTSVISNLFSALQISFGTSVVGLEVSVLLGLLVMLVHRRQNVYFSDMEDATGTMLSLVRNAENKDAYLAEFKQVSNGMEQLDERIDQQTRTISRDFTTVGERLMEQSKEFQDGLEGLQSLRMEWSKFVTDIKESQQMLVNNANTSQITIGEKYQGFLHDIENNQRKFIEDAEQTLDLLSVGKLGAEITNTIEKTGDSIGLAIQPEIERVTSQLTELTDSNQSLLVSNKILDQSLNEAHTGLNELEAAKINMDQFLQKLNESQSDLLKNIETVQAEVSIKELGQIIQNDIVKTGKELSQVTSKQLTSVSMEISKYNKALNELSKTTTLIVKKIPQSLVHDLARIVGTFGIIAAGFWAFWSIAGDLGILGS